MLFIRQMPFFGSEATRVILQTIAQTHNDNAQGKLLRGMANHPWLPITVRTPASNQKANLPHKGNRPFPWLLDTGCTGPGFVRSPGKLRRFAITRRMVDDFRYGVTKDTLNEVSTAGIKTKTFNSIIEVWLHSNIRGLANYPLRLRMDTGLQIQADSRPATPNDKQQTAPSVQRQETEEQIRQAEREYQLEDKDHDSKYEIGDYIIGMRELIDTNVTVEIDARDKCFSVWVPSRVWMEQLGEIADKPIPYWKALQAPFSSLCNPFLRGQTSTVLMRA